jgi:AraC-like DNA-binding protein
MGQAGSPVVRRAADFDEFAAHPVGSFVAGDGWLVFCAQEDFWGAILHGRPDREAASQMTRAFEVELGMPPHVVLVDAAELDGIDAGAFDHLQQFARVNLQGSRRNVQRLALVLPRGVSGAVVAGFYGVLGPPCPIHVAADRNQALAWLERELDAGGMVAEARGAPPFLGALRALLRESHPSVDDAAARLGLSVRTLQRRLAESRTSFARELRDARVHQAKRRLRESDDAITVIAIDLGFGSTQHFSRLFRSLTGMTPTDWRAQKR